MTEPHSIATHALWRALGELERRLDALEAPLTALCALLSDDPTVGAAVQRALAGEAPSESQEAGHA